ncbi:thymidylate kinase [Alicyclobacillus cellulosilyticus]|uniref:Thymidylate kinase n=1 Tax=Alicyclobacillus cellulosilyticus TaxID=1003997 RepID=A0A917KIM9_9BACL|nr:dTMP kinase [Alicyclobacillus cellulosilyticus]GGJ13101.1 thymidylate kinase [Alicyclobacillus cellulosilyticus]
MFITFEGLDGAGKTTQAERLRRKLAAAGWTVVATREPGGTPIGDQLRALLLHPEHRDMAPETEVLLYAASRAQLVRQVIRPALRTGAIVLCDRFVDASIAYQGAGLGVGEEAVAAVNRLATGGLRPDLTFLLDVPVEESRRRVRASRAGQGLDRIEQRDSAYFYRVRESFLRLAAAEPGRIRVLDGRLPADAVEQEIWAVVVNCLRKGGTG